MKRTKFTRVLAIVLGVMCLFALAACGGEKAPADDQKELTVVKFGTQVQYEPFFKDMVEPLKAKGIDLQIQLFDDVITPNNALEEGSIDANFFQHKPYMESFNASNGTHLVAAEPYLMHQCSGIYSPKYKTLEELPDGAKVCIAADPSSQDLHLKLMQEAGLITLGKLADGATTYSVFDIAENPKNLEIVQVELQSQPAAYPDVDITVCATISMAKAGIDYSAPLFLSKDFTAFPMVVAVREADKDAQWIKDMMEVFTGEGAAARINEVMAGTFVAMFE